MDYRAIVKGINKGTLVEDEIVEVVKTTEHRNILNFYADSPNTPAAALESILTRDDPYLAARVLANPSCPSTVLEAYIFNNTLNDEQKQATAHNPNLTGKIVEKIMETFNANVADKLIDNPATPVDALHKLWNIALDGKTPGFSAKTYAYKFFGHANADTRIKVESAFHPSTKYNQKKITREELIEYMLPDLPTIDNDVPIEWLKEMLPTVLDARCLPEDSKNG